MILAVGIQPATSGRAAELVTNNVWGGDLAQQQAIISSVVAKTRVGAFLGWILDSGIACMP